MCWCWFPKVVISLKVVFFLFFLLTSCNLNFPNASSASLQTILVSPLSFSSHFFFLACTILLKNSNKITFFLPHPLSPFTAFSLAIDFGFGLAKSRTNARFATWSTRQFSKLPSNYWSEGWVKNWCYIFHAPFTSKGFTYFNASEEMVYRLLSAFPFYS